MNRLILADRLEWDRRAAVLEDGRLIAYFSDDAFSAVPRPGAVVAARVARVFPDHDRISVTIGALEASLRIGRQPPPRPGEMIMATVTAEPRDGKPVQLRRGVFIETPLVLADSTATGVRLSQRLRALGTIPPELDAGECQLTLRTAAAEAGDAAVRAAALEASARIRALTASLPAQPGVIADGPDAVAAAQLAFPDADCRDTADADAWALVEIALDAALAPCMELAQGARLHVSTPPGAAVFDGDSAASAMAPMALARAMVPAIADALLLRRISGPVVVDFPRLDKRQQAEIHDLMEAALSRDPQRPHCHGFTSGGLYTMTRPWRWRPLADCLAPTPRRLGLDALRLAIRAGAGHDLTPVIRLPGAGLAWLDGDGASTRARVLKALAITPQFRSDEAVATAVLDQSAR